MNDPIKFKRSDVSRNLDGLIQARLDGTVILICSDDAAAELLVGLQREVLAGMAKA